MLVHALYQNKNMNELSKGGWMKGPIDGIINEVTNSLWARKEKKNWKEKQ